MDASPPDLLLVLPVFNEEESIEQVVEPWFEMLDKLVDRFVILAIDDGSKDSSFSKLQALRHALGDRIEVRSRENRGHGQTCLEGYREAIARSIPWVAQIDSDGQCDPRYFEEFWEARESFDVIYGRRSREDGLRRVLASNVLGVCLRVGFGVRCIDANVPYRLMNTANCSSVILTIPGTFHLVNVAMAVLLGKSPQIREYAVPIVFRERIGGEPSVPFSKFAMRALELFSQLRKLKTSD